MIKLICPENMSFVQASGGALYFPNTAHEILVDEGDVSSLRHKGCVWDFETEVAKSAATASNPKVPSSDALSAMRSRIPEPKGVVEEKTSTPRQKQPAPAVEPAPVVKPPREQTAN